MRWVACCMSLFFVTTVFGQVKDSIPANDSLKQTRVDSIPAPMSQSSTDYDKMTLTNGDSIIVRIIKETDKDIAFQYPLNSVINQLPLSMIKQVYYRDGKNKTVVNQGAANAAAVIPDNENVWKIVVITSNESDVADLREIGPIDALAEAKTNKTPISLLEKNANITIQKRAVRMGATKVLVKKKIVEQSYGELPYVELQGVAYGPR